MIKKQLVKKCRGVGRALGSEACEEVKPIHKYGLCKSCFLHWLFNTKEGKETLNKSKITGKKRADKEEKQRKNREKLENKSIQSLIQEARTPFQKLIRIRDHGKNCICCDRPLPFNVGNYDAGHFLKAELYTGLIFNPDNTHGQSKYCNKYEHGNENGYKDGLIKRIGVERYNHLNDIKNSLKQYKFSKEQLIKMKKYYNKELRLVEKGLKNINDVDFNIGINL